MKTEEYTDERKEQENLLSAIRTLMDNTNFIAEVCLIIPNADYEGMLHMFNEHTDFFRSGRISWQIRHIDSGFELRIDRINKLTRRL